MRGPSNRERCPASAFSASASTTMGVFDSCTKRRMNCTVSGCCPMPGPIAMTVFFLRDGGQRGIIGRAHGNGPAVCFGQGFRHDLGRVGCNRCDRRCRRSNGREPRTCPQGRDARHRRGACFSASARDHQHMAVQPFVRIAGARLKQACEVCGLRDRGRALVAFVKAWRASDGHNVHFACPSHTRARTTGTASAP